MSSSIPGRATKAAATAQHRYEEAPAPRLPAGVRLERRNRRGQLLVAQRDFAAGEMVLQEAPLAVLPPFMEHVQWPAASASSSAPASHHGWICVESLVRALRFRDDALLLYRAVQLYYLLFLTAAARAQADASFAASQRILALFDPARTEAENGESDALEVNTSSGDLRASNTQSKQTARRIAQQAELTAAVRSDAGRAALEELFACVGAQAQASMGVLVERISLNADGSTPSGSPFDERHFLSHTLPLASIFNVNNMDCIASVSSSSAAALTPAAAASEGSAFTGVYDTLSRINHACAPNCVHGMEREDEYKKHGIKATDAQLTPQQLATAAQTNDTASNSAALASAYPFVRTLRTLCTVAAGEEITISYLSPQLLCQSTRQRQMHLRQHWNFSCRCARCEALDTARVLKCPSCSSGMVLLQPMSSPASAAAAHDADDSANSEPPFSLVNTCACDLIPAVTAFLLKGESIVEDEWGRFTASLPRCRQPVELSALFTQLLARHHISDLHWVAFEFNVVQRDLQALLRKTIEEMERIKQSVWFLERISQRKLFRFLNDMPAVMARGGKFATYSHESLLIDCEAGSFLSPLARVSALVASSELVDAWLSFAEVLWVIHGSKTPELQRMLAQRCIYFMLCARKMAALVYPQRREMLATMDAKLQQRVGLARAKLVDLSKLVEEAPPVAVPRAGAEGAPAGSGARVAPGTALSCHSPVCPTASFSSAPPVAALVCTRCRAVRYCSKACQAADWKLHKPACKAPK